MPKATIMLAQSNARKHIDPEGQYQVSEKLDGVPVLIKYDESGTFLTATSRQGKPVFSIDHILVQLEHWGKLAKDAELVGELWIKNTPFKDISGLARKQETTEDTRKLQLYTFPEFFYTYDFDYGKNIKDVHRIPSNLCLGSTLLHYFEGDNWKSSYGWLEDMRPAMVTEKNNPYFEGFIARKYKTPWLSGKRSNDFLKLIEDPTLDLKVIQIFPAWKPKEVNEDGDEAPQDFYERVGSFECMWGNGETCKVGAGKLSHKEAEALWENKEDVAGRIIEVKYKRDPSYNVPRQPTFQHFRDDKDEYDTTF